MSILEEKGTEKAESMTELERLKAENEALKAKLESAKHKGAGINVTVCHDGTVKEYNVALKVSEKGAISIYGFGRFPITVYAFVLRAILGLAPEIEDFIAKNDTRLAWAKAEKEA